MKWHVTIYPLVVSLFFLLGSCEKPSVKENHQDEAAIKKAAKLYEEAFNKKDSKALSALWTQDAEYENPETGEVIKGKEALENLFQSHFSEDGESKIVINIQSVSFPNPNMAIETGVATVTDKNSNKNETAYKATYKKINEQWFLSKVDEVDILQPESQYEHLKDLEWLIGDWIDEDKDSKIETHTEWDRYKNFITQHFSVTVEGFVELEGKQIIAWDPIEQHIRSWVFDSDGGFGEGVWRKQSDRWIVETNATLPDGRKGSSINTYTPVDNNSFRWESTGRDIDGELLPDIKSVINARKKI